MSENIAIQTGNVTIGVEAVNVKRTTCFKIGDPVKILVQEYNSSTSYPGVLVGVDAFETLPTLIVAYMDTRYAVNADSLKFAYVNSRTADKYEIIATNPYDLAVSRDYIVQQIEAAILKKEQEIQDLRHKMEFFMANFGMYFGETWEGGAAK